MSLLNDLKLSKVHTAMMKILKDGLPHTKQELHKCCGPSCPENVVTQICLLRSKLPEDYTIVCVLFKRKAHWRLMRQINPKT